MNEFRELADNLGVRIVVGAGVLAAIARAYVYFKPHFQKPTRTGFDNPKVKASRERSAQMVRDLGIDQPK